MEVTISNSPRFIEVFAAREEKCPAKSPCPENFCDHEIINWNDVVCLGQSVFDGWLCLSLRELAYDDEADRIKNGYEELLATLWVKEDFSHFVRRVNKGLAITMIKDGDE